jgi:hypothetical protein
MGNLIIFVVPVIAAWLLGSLWWKRYGGAYKNNPSKSLVVRWAICGVIYFLTFFLVSSVKANFKLGTWITATF